MSDIKPFHCAACDKLLSSLWQVETVDHDSYTCFDCGLPFENDEVKIYAN